MKLNRTQYVWVLAAITFLISSGKLYAQGCIVARSSSSIGGPETEGGYLAPGEFDFSIGLRHQFSFRHFVGDVEQKQRIQQGTEVMNKINLMNFNLNYQVSRRFSFQIDAPLLLASRRSNNSPYTTTAQGVGDIIVSAQGWVWNPTENTRGNVAFSLGAMLPSGRDNVMNTVDKLDGKGPVNVLDDYSIQPGSGGYGMLFGWQAFKNFGSSAQAYFNGSYIATPQNTNGVVRSTTAKPLLQQVSISDQYLLESRCGGAASSGSRTVDHSGAAVGRRSGEGLDRKQRWVPQAWIRGVYGGRIPVRAWPAAFHGDCRKGHPARSHSQLSRPRIRHARRRGIRRLPLAGELFGPVRRAAARNAS